jgi:hypothetical protein
VSPVQHMPGSRQARYKLPVVRRAQELRRVGWTYGEIRRLLHRELGVNPGLSTVERWCIPVALAERRVVMQRVRSRRSRSRSLRPQRNRSPEWKLGRMTELVACGVPPRFVALVAGCWWGEDLTEMQVRERLGLNVACSPKETGGTR